ncbi:hypothetical protein SAMN05216573_111257 [Bradyrhizobium sp. Rc3b]|uniref:hypothetical protein n=1 Tax=unclassified Bradyrhizobium TaxID=2631580 RepID=UPI0008E45CC6|nr:MULTISPECIES: hypothetical protein [unclassified Bradyrhizobium]MBB4375655.1 hypothetical protein [Bradyrhizobium sp. SBR1B]SFN33874.1 hypothetical protein SAMN05216573_111257 [Bradyrhizobium sp. Rc3b]
MYAITFAAAAIIWPFIVAMISSRFGADVSARFLERPGLIPSTGEALTRRSLEQWLRSPTNGPFRRPYARCIMLLDVIYIFLVGGFFVTGSLWLAAALTWPDPANWWYCVAVCIVPAAYIISDFVEDAMIAQSLLRHDVSDTKFNLMRLATTIKIVTFGAAAAQTVVLGICALLLSAA